MENPNFYLEGVVRDKNETQDFEGPLSLILLLLSKNKIEIRDIVISDILDQYLAYLDEMQSMDLEIASEFVQMAAHLLYIKTRTLLSGDEEVSELELLKSSLEQLQARDVYAAVQQIVPARRKASEIGTLYGVKPPEPLPAESRQYAYRHEPVDLLKAMARIYARGMGKPPAPDMSDSVPPRIIYSVRDKSMQILHRLKKGKTDLKSLYQACSSRSEIVATFVSVLELCSLGSVRIEREGEDYCLCFVGGDVEEILEKIVET